MRKTSSILITLLTSQLAFAAVAGASDTDSALVSERSHEPGKASAGSETEEVMLGLNFRGAPLEQVLEYIADRAGLVIVYETPLKAKVDVWSNEKVSVAEGIALLNTVAAKNGLVALRSGRVITILTTEAAKKREMPLITGGIPEKIPKNTDMVTQIIPLKGLAAAQMVRDLSTLLPPGATFVANEGTNSILMTDTQVHIRRMVEILGALDTQVSGAASIRVFPMKFADAKTVATVMTDMFPDTVNRGAAVAGKKQNGPTGGLGGIPGSFGGVPTKAGPGGGGGPGGFGGGNNSSPQQSSAQTSKLVALADEQSNSLVIKGSESQISQVEKILLSLDINVKGTTELRVFYLVNADPTEVSEAIAGIFPDSADPEDRRGGGYTISGGPSPAITLPSTTSDSSDRTPKQTKVSSVPDTRTRSLVVRASSQLMPQIAEVIGRLDSDARGKKKVKSRVPQRRRTR